MSELTFFQRLVSRLVLVYFFVCILILLFLHKLRDWFHGQDSHSDFSHTISFCETKLQKLRNPCVVTQLISAKNNVFGYPLTLKISSSSECRCHILMNVPTERLHTALTDKFEVLKSYLIENAAGTKTVHAGTESLRINVNDFEPFRVTYGNKRTHYSAVIAFVTDSETVDEQIAISCYVVHVRFSESEHFDTGVLYTFWKTNWSRLLTPQALYAARDNSDSASTGSPDGRSPDNVNHWQPACFVCLNSVNNGDLRVFLPCRHAGLCADCFTSFVGKAFNPTNPLDRLLCCPLCRTPINSVLCLPSH